MPAHATDQPAGDAPPTSQPHSIRKNLGFAVVGNGVLNGGRLLVFVLLTRWATPDVVGVFVYANSVLAAPIIMFCALELRSAYVADTRAQFTFGVYRALRNTGMAVAGLVMAGAVLWRSATLESVWLVALLGGVCAGRLVLRLAEINWGVFQRRERLDLMAWSNVARGVTLVAPFVVLLPLAARGTQRAVEFTVWAVAIHVVLWVLIGRFVDARNVRRGDDVDDSWDWKSVGRLAWQTLPLGLVMLIITLCDAVPRQILANQSDNLTDLGYFGALSIITLAAGFLIVQVGTAAGNRLATTYQTDLPAFVRLAAKMTAIALVTGGSIVVATWLYGKQFLAVVYQPDYAQHYPAFLILVCGEAIVLLASVFGFAVTHMRRFWIQVPLQLTVLASTWTAALLLIPNDPVKGAAWTAVVRATTQALLYFGAVVVGIRHRHRLTHSA